MDKQQAFVEWLRDQLQPSGAEFGLGDGSTVTFVNEDRRGGIDAMDIYFDDGESFSLSIGPNENE